MTLAKMSVGALSAFWLGLAAMVPFDAAWAHEGHKMQCNESSLKAMKADVQAMPEGASKATAAKEIQAAEAMMQKKYAKACVDHLQNAMEATEK